MWSVLVGVYHSVNWKNAWWNAKICWIIVHCYVCSIIVSAAATVVVVVVVLVVVIVAVAGGSSSSSTQALGGNSICKHLSIILQVTDV